MLRIEAVSKGREPVIIFLAIMAIGLSVAFYLYFAVDRYSLLYYWDSVSHLVAARKLVDWSENPGVNQIGTVWMPLPHFLLLPFSLIDGLFTTGFAGTALSLTCLGITSVFLYKIIKLQNVAHITTATSYVAVAGAFLYATNPNILYLGITSMTEAPFMLFFVASAYFFQKWIQQNHNLKDLIICSIFLSFATLCRYEAWFLPVFLVIIAGTFAIKNAKRYNQKQKSFAIIIIVASLISLSSITFWLAWNQYHYGNPLEFSSTKYYSASWYAENRPFRELLFLKPANVLSVYGVTAFVVYGPFLLGAGAIGYYIFKRGHINGKNFVLIFLALPPIFTIISLLIGIGEMSYWFNSRFVVLLSPLVIVMACSFLTGFINKVRNRKIIISVVGMLFASQLAMPFFYTVVTINDAKGGFSVEENLLARDTGEALKSLYNGNGTVMVLTGSGLEQRIMITSGLPLKKFDEIIGGSTWKASFKEPWSFDSWLIITRKPGSDAISTTQYWLDRSDELLRHYRVIYENKYYTIMLLKK